VGEEPSGQILRLIRIRLATPSFAKISPARQYDFGLTGPTRLRLTRRQLLIRTHNEMLSVIAMRVSNPDRSPLVIHARDTAPTRTGFLEIVGDDFLDRGCQLAVFSGKLPSMEAEIDDKMPV
jgi:hypothetical protein